MNKVKFSVLLSIYYKEKPEYFSECMESIYSQTVLPDEIVLVEDGRLTDGFMRQSEIMNAGLGNKFCYGKA